MKRFTCSAQANIRLLSVLLAALAGSGCAPGLGTSLPIGTIPRPLAYDYREVPAQVVLGLFSDGRTDESIGTVNGRTINVQGDVTGEVRAALSEYLKARGIESSVGAKPMIRGNVLVWNVQVTPDFPSSTAEANASVELELLDPDNRVLHTGRYSGTAARQDPLLNEEKIQTVLGEAMGFALNEAAADQAMINRLRSASTRQ